MRVFLDTNVLVSAFTTRGLCADLMRAVLAEHEFVTSEVVLGELRRVLRRRFGYSPEAVQAVVSFLREYPVEPATDTLPAIDIRDPDDLKVLASAMAAGADVLVSGDKDLLCVAEQAEIAIRSPRSFWDLIKNS